MRNLGYRVEPVADEKATAKHESHDHDHAGCSGHDHDHDHDHDHSHEEAEAKQIASSTDSFRFQVDGMDCASCAAKIDTAVRRVGGVKDVSVSVTNGTMTVNHDGTARADEIAAK